MLGVARVRMRFGRSRPPPKPCYPAHRARTLDVMADETPNAPQILQPDEDDDIEAPPLCVPYATSH
jgi:hypothetical protein